GRLVEQRRDGLFGGAVEESLKDVTQRGPLGVVARDSGPVDVARAVLFVPDVPLVLENPQHRANGRVARRVRERLLHVGRRGAPVLIQNVEDLPLAAAQITMHTTP